VKQTPCEPFPRQEKPVSRAWNIVKKAIYGSGILLMVVYCATLWLVFTIPLAFYFLWLKLNGGQP